MGGIVAQKLEENGYIKFANELTIQWGKSSGITTAGKLITFPIAFNTIYGVFAMPMYISGTPNKSVLLLNYVNTTNFNVRTDDATTNCLWTAIGMI